MKKSPLPLFERGSHISASLKPIASIHRADIRIHIIYNYTFLRIAIAFLVFGFILNHRGRGSGIEKFQTSYSSWKCESDEKLN